MSQAAQILLVAGAVVAAAAYLVRRLLRQGHGAACSRCPASPSGRAPCHAIPVRGAASASTGEPSRDDGDARHPPDRGR